MLGVFCLFAFTIPALGCLAEYLMDLVVRKLG